MIYSNLNLESLESSKETILFTKKIITIVVMLLLTSVFTLVLGYRFLIENISFSNLHIFVIILSNIFLCFVFIGKKKYNKCITNILVFLLVATHLVALILEGQNFSSVMVYPMFAMIISYALKGGTWGLFSSLCFFALTIIYLLFYGSVISSGEMFLVISLLITIVPASLTLLIREWEHVQLIKLVTKQERHSTKVKLMSKLLEEIVNPLSVARGYSKLLSEADERKTFSDEEQKEMLELIVESLKIIETRAKLMDMAKNEKVEEKSQK